MAAVDLAVAAQNRRPREGSTNSKGRASRISGLESAHPELRHLRLCTMTSSVWAYIRVSGDEQADRGFPVAGQRRAITDHAREHSLDVGRGDEGSG